MTDANAGGPGEGGTATLSASMQMLHMLGGFQVSQALYTVAKLGIASALLTGPLPVERLAAMTGTMPDPLARLVRSLAPVGVFRTNGSEVELTELGATLAEGSPGSVHAGALYWMETHYSAFEELRNTLTTGEPAATIYYGVPFFEWISKDPDLVDIQNKAMASATESLKAGMFAGYELPPGELVVDIGGADGTLLARLLADEPDRQGIVFDLPQVAPAAHSVIARQGLDARVRVEQGDFFKAVPAANVYLLSFIMHDWDDASCERILRNIARAALPGARLVVIDTVISPGDEPELAKALDLTMLAMLNGRERTAAEFGAVLESGGFTLERIVSTPTPFSFAEAFPQ